MNKVDLIISCIILLFMLVGYWKGLVKTVLSFVQYFAVIFLSIILTPTISDILIKRFDLSNIIFTWIQNNGTDFFKNIKYLNETILLNISERIINIAVFIILFLLLKIIFMIVIMTLNKIADLPIINTVNKLGGTIIGFINGILIVYVIVLLMNWIPLGSSNKLKLELDNSLIGSKISQFVPKLATELVDFVSEEVYMKRSNI